MSYKNNKFKISAQTWNDKFELPGESYYVSDIKDYFNQIIKKHETMIILTSEIMKLLRRIKNNVTNSENGDNIPYLEITEVVSVNCNIVNNDYHHS